MRCEGDEREWNVPFPLDVRLTLSVQGRGRGDPTYRADEAGAIWRTSLTPEGPATLRVPVAATHRLRTASPGSARTGHAGDSRAWGPGATWLLDALPGCLGLHDDVAGFDPGEHPLIRDAARQ